LASKEGGLKADWTKSAALMQPIADGLAKMDDETAGYIVRTCLSSLKRLQGENWALVWNATANACMFDDIDLGALVPLVMRVIQFNLGPFIQGLLTSQQT